MKRRGAGVRGGRAPTRRSHPGPRQRPPLCLHPKPPNATLPGCREGDPPPPPRLLFIDYTGKSPAAAAMQQAPVKAEGKGEKKTTGRERKETGHRGSRRAGAHRRGQPGRSAGGGPLPPPLPGPHRRPPSATSPPRGTGPAGPPLPHTPLTMGPSPTAGLPSARHPPPPPAERPPPSPVTAMAVRDWGHGAPPHTHTPPRRPARSGAGRLPHGAARGRGAAPRFLAHSALFSGPLLAAPQRPARPRTARPPAASASPPVSAAPFAAGPGQTTAGSRGVGGDERWGKGAGRSEPTRGKGGGGGGEWAGGGSAGEAGDTGGAEGAAAGGGCGGGGGAQGTRLGGREEGAGRGGRAHRRAAARAGEWGSAAPRGGGLGDGRSVRPQVRRRRRQRLPGRRVSARPQEKRLPVADPSPAASCYCPCGARGQAGPGTAGRPCSRPEARAGRPGWAPPGVLAAGPAP